MNLIKNNTARSVPGGERGIVASGGAMSRQIEGKFGAVYITSRATNSLTAKTPRTTQRAQSVRSA
jgi:hypothetical protein